MVVPSDVFATVGDWNSRRRGAMASLQAVLFEDAEDDVPVSSPSTARWKSSRSSRAWCASSWVRFRSGTMSWTSARGTAGAVASKGAAWPGIAAAQHAAQPEKQVGIFVEAGIIAEVRHGRVRPSPRAGRGIDRDEADAPGPR